MPMLNYPLIISLTLKIRALFFFFYNLWIEPDSILGGPFYVEVAFLCRFALRSLNKVLIKLFVLLGSFRLFSTSTLFQ